MSNAPIPILTNTRNMTENSDNKSDLSGRKTRLDPSLGTSAKLCTPCQSLFDNWDSWLLKSGKLYPHHQHPAELRSIASKHCPFCYQFWKGGPRVFFIDPKVTNASMIGTHELAGIYVGSNPHRHLETNATENYFRIALQFRIPNLQELSMKPNFPPASSSTTDKSLFPASSKRDPLVWGEYPVALHRTCRQSNKPSIDELEARSTKSSLKMAKKWLHECSSHHDACKVSLSKYSPTRLVSTGVGRCRVYLRNEFKTSVEYATLSHCWGTIKHLTLSKSNLNQLQMQIPDEALSLTIRDAIMIARDLGFAYIWIDTLCIVQDDPEDWRREAAAMSNVYGSSGLNIAAAGARDGRDGCFFPRPAHWNFQVELSDNHGSSSYSATPLNLYSTCLSNMPLMERGWVLQERLLAVRTLHFTTTEVFWECNHTIACESSPKKLPDFIMVNPKILHKQRLVDSMWPWIVTTYSGCKLTYASDKLVAISGLAREIQQQTHDRYVAGLWTRNMEAQLCWYTSAPGPRRKNGTYIAPSWSWAALDTQVAACFTDFSRLSVLMSVMDVEIEHTGPDSLGAIDNAIVRICCYGLCSVQFDTATKELLSSDNKRLNGGVVYPDNIPDDGEEQLQDVLLLSMFESYGTRSMVSGLVLQRADPGKGVYRRVGLFHVPTKGNLIDTLGNIVDEGDVNFSKCYTEVFRDSTGMAFSYAIDVI